MMIKKSNSKNHDRSEARETSSNRAKAAVIVVAALAAIAAGFFYYQSQKPLTAFPPLTKEQVASENDLSLDMLEEMSRADQIETSRDLGPHLRKFGTSAQIQRYDGIMQGRGLPAVPTQP